jgi:hypothetical protein
MSNEVLAFIIVFLDLAAVLLAWRLGKEWLIATILANIILTMIFEAKMTSVFGWAMTCGAAFYSSIFIATDILSEHHGKKEAYRSIWMGFLVLAIFTVMGQLVLQYGALDANLEIANAMNIVFAPVPRIVVAGFIAYLIAQSFDIWLFHNIREKTGGKKLWLRNNLSTLTSMMIDSVTFFPLAFYGTVENEVLLMLIVTGWCFKAPVAVLDTPFMYLSYIVVGKTPPDFEKLKLTRHESPATGL